MAASTPKLWCCHTPEHEGQGRAFLQSPMRLSVSSSPLSPSPPTTGTCSYGRVGTVWEAAPACIAACCPLLPAGRSAAGSWLRSSGILDLSLQVLGSPCTAVTLLLATVWCRGCGTEAATTPEPGTRTDLAGVPEGPGSPHQAW